MNNEHHDHDHDHDHEHIYLTLDDGTDIECHVLGIFQVDELEYIALVPIDSEDGEVYLYRFEEDDEGIDLINIEDDEEFEMASQAFYELFDEEEFEYYEDDDDFEYDDEDDFDE